jgi:polar amino acid transport system substrate-binding protein
MKLRLFPSAALAMRWGVLLMLAGFASMACSATLEEIQRRGTLVVGVKKDVPLWGMLDASRGTIVGIEPDLARQVADHLGVKLQLVGVLTAERADAVISGKVDMVIATLSDTPERRVAMTLVLPHYYASGTNLLSRKSEHFKQWTDLRNRRVCGRRGAFYNRPITVAYGADVIALYGNDLSSAALRDGRCAGLLYDDVAIISLLQNPDWSRDFEMPLKSLYQVPWAIALAPAARGTELEHRVSQLVIHWHRSGLLKKLEAQWGVPATRYLADKYSTWNQKLGTQWLCGESITSTTPPECL